MYILSNAAYFLSIAMAGLGAIAYFGLLLVLTGIGQPREGIDQATLEQRMLLSTCGCFTIAFCLYCFCVWLEHTDEKNELASGSAHLRCGVEPLELDAGLGGRELPVHPDLPLVPLRLPRPHHLLQPGRRPDAAV